MTMCVHIHMNTFIRTYIYIYTYTHIHTVMLHIRCRFNVESMYDVLLSIIVSSNSVIIFITHCKYKYHENVSAIYYANTQRIDFLLPRCRYIKRSVSDATSAVSVTTSHASSPRWIRIRRNAAIHGTVPIAIPLWVLIACLLIPFTLQNVYDFVRIMIINNENEINN